MVYRNALSSSGTENASETPFQTPKPNHTHAPIDSTVVSVTTKQYFLLILDSKNDYNLELDKSSSP